MKICPKCRTKYENGSAFCGSCGAQLKDICPKCGSHIQNGQKFCGSCGSKLQNHQITNKIEFIAPFCGFVSQYYHRYIRPDEKELFIVSVISLAVFLIFVLIRLF